MGIQITGKLYKIFEAKQVSDRFTKREFVLETTDNPRYPQLVLLEVTGDRIFQLDEVRTGDEVRVDFSVRGREWKSPSGEVKYFNTLDVWKIETVRLSAPTDARGGSHAPPPSGGGGGHAQHPNAPENVVDEIPF